MLCTEKTSYITLSTLRFYLIIKKELALKLRRLIGFSKPVLSSLQKHADSHGNMLIS